MLLTVDENKKKCWVTEVRSILSVCGFHYAWLYQGVGNTHSFLRLFKLRVSDIFKQEWSGAILNKDI